MTSLALVAPPPAPLLAQLERLHSDLARPELDLADVVDVHNRANVLLAYCREANVAFDLAHQATAAKLRLERRAGAELDRIILEHAPWPSHAHQKRRYVPRGILKSYGIRGDQAHRWRVVSRIPEPDFEAALETARRTQRELTTARLMHLATDTTGFGRRPATTSDKLRHILNLMRSIRSVTTKGELGLVAQIVTISRSWSAALPTDGGEIRCLLCARVRPPAQPKRCLDCGGGWVRVPG